MIRDAYKNLNVRQTFTPFILVQGDDYIQNSRKLSQKLMREFSNVYGKTFAEASTHQIVSIMEKFASHNWMLAQTYNSLIEAFGTNFNDFSFRELASFTTSLAKVGLRHEEIIAESIKKLVTVAGRPESEEGAAPAKTNNENYQVSFKTVLVPFFKAITHLDLGKTDELIAQIIDEKFVKRAVPGNLSFFEQSLRDQSDHEEILLAILKGRLDEKDSRFKDLAESLIAKINESEIELNSETSVKLYEALCITPNTFQNKLAPKNADKLKQMFTRVNANRKVSGLYENSKILPALQALGYADVTYLAPLEGLDGSNFISDYYSPSTNTLFLTMDSENLCYDRQTPNGNFRIRERVAQQLTQKPTIYQVNVFNLSNIAEKEEKIKFLNEKCEVKLVGDKINLDVVGF